MRRHEFLPEGMAPLFPDGQPLSAIERAMADQQVLTGLALRCDSGRTLHVRFGGWEGVIPRSEAVHPAISGAERDIAVLSLVGKPVSFVVTELSIDGGGKPRLLLSRRRAQEQAIAWLLDRAAPGTVLPARVTHLAAFGAFVDLGGGFISLIPLENISMARMAHPAQRFQVGQDILAMVTAVDQAACRISLSHKELLGTWLENAAAFAPGDTVAGVVSAIREYGIFVELAPNLSGLADFRPDLAPGDGVSVYIRSIRPESRKIKLQIIQAIQPPAHRALKYFITDGVVENWRY